jgi:hypothetical protein
MRRIFLRLLLMQRNLKRRDLGLNNDFMSGPFIIMLIIIAIQSHFSFRRFCYALLRRNGISCTSSNRLLNLLKYKKNSIYFLCR